MIESGLWMALLLFIVILIMPVFTCELRYNWSILFSYWLLIALHQVVAVTNAFFFTTLGAGADASTFNRIGSELAQSGSFSFAIGSKFYENMLGVVYSLFGSSHFLGEQLSVLAFAFSCVVLIKIRRQLDLVCYQAPILLVFGALPTMVLFGSTTMRESYQVLFFMLAVYFGIKMHLKGGINRNLMTLMLSALVMGLFHKGLIVYMLLLTVLFLVFSLKPSRYLWRIKKLRLLLLFIAPILLVGVLAAVQMNVSGLGALSSLAKLDVGEFARTYRENTVVARATYGITLNLSSSLAFISSSSVLYFYYLFAPFPWQVGNIMDVYAVLESIMRIVLIYYSIKHWRNSYGVKRRLLGLMLVLFFSMSFMWAMGTTNYGTAMRHHMLTWWILVVMGLPLFMKSITRFLSSIVGNKHSLPASVEGNS